MAETSPNPTENTPNPAASEAVSSPEGSTQAQGPQATGQGEAAESFTNIDPKTLTPELRTVYDNMYRGFQEKNRGMAEVRKQASEYKEKADIYDELSRDDQFVSYWNNPKAQKQPAATPEAESVDNDPETEVRTLKNQVSDLQKSQQRNDTDRFIDSYAMETDKDGNLLRPEFRKLTDNGLVPMFFAQDPSKTQKDRKIKLAKAYTRAVDFVNGIREEGRKAVLPEIQSKANQTVEEPSVATGASYSGPDPKKLTTREAFEMSKRGQFVPQ